MTTFVAPADARVFLGRLTLVEPAAVVRLRPTSSGRTALWARLPWGVLVTREVEGAPPDDVTVGAADLLHAASVEPARRDADWRWPLPPSTGTVLEEVPVARVRELAAAAAGTLRQVTRDGLDGRPVGVRMLREALLDHIAVVVESEAGRVEVPQRLVQAVTRMGFLGDPAGAATIDSIDPTGGPTGEADDGGPTGEADDGGALVRVCQAGRWVGLAAPYGTAWLPPPAGLTVRPVAG